MEKLAIKLSMLSLLILGLSSCSGEYFGNSKATSTEVISGRSQGKEESNHHVSSSPSESEKKIESEIHQVLSSHQRHGDLVLVHSKKKSPRKVASKEFTRREDDRAHHLESFVVNDSGLSLSVISTMVYGTCKRWREISNWNHLKDPNRIYVGQKLIVKDPVSLTDEEMNMRLLQLWRSRLAKRERSLVEHYWSEHSESGHKSVSSHVHRHQNRKKHSNHKTFGSHKKKSHHRKHAHRKHHSHHRKHAHAHRKLHRKKQAHHKNRNHKLSYNRRHHHSGKSASLKLYEIKKAIHSTSLDQQRSENQIKSTEKRERSIATEEKSTPHPEASPKPINLLFWK